MGRSKKQNKKPNRKHKNKSKKYLGGSTLAYPSNNVPTVTNTNLAYTGSNSNTNLNRAYPAQGPAAGGFNFLVPQTGGTKTHHILSTCKHRKGCKCSICKSKKQSKKKRGGSSQSNNGLPYPNGLLGSPWTPNVSTWPGVDGIAMNNNHLAYNTYKPVDISRQMLDIGAQPPFTYKGGKNSKKKKGGGIGNLLGDFNNLGNMIPYNFGTTYNAINGYEAPVNPLPYKDQLTRDPVSYNLYT
jgi:hypothetical protein